MFLGGDIRVLDTIDCLDGAKDENDDFDTEQCDGGTLLPELKRRLSSGGCSALRLWNSSGGTYPRYLSEGPRLGYNSQLLLGKLSGSVEF